jgi:hypothetical protein
MPDGTERNALDVVLSAWCEMSDVYSGSWNIRVRWVVMLWVVGCGLWAVGCGLWAMDVGLQRWYRWVGGCWHRAGLVCTSAKQRSGCGKVRRRDSVGDPGGSECAEEAAGADLLLSDLGMVKLFALPDPRLSHIIVKGDLIISDANRNSEYFSPRPFWQTAE